MAVSAIVHEGRLERGFDPRDFCQVNIASKLALVHSFKVEFVNFVSVNHNNACLFRVRGIDEHFLCHVIRSHTRLRRAPGGDVQDMC